jgi:hypothetical protein
MRLIFFSFLVFALIPPAVAQEKPAASGKKIFSINITPPPDSSATELEFSDTDLAKANAEQAAQARTPTT